MKARLPREIRQDRWETDLTKQVEDLKKTINNLNESEKNVVARLTRKTSDEISNLETFINRTGLKADKLVAKMEKDATKKGQGGPFVELRADTEPGEFLKASISNLDNRVARLENLEKPWRLCHLRHPWIISRYPATMENEEIQSIVVGPCIMDSTWWVP